MEIKTIRLLSWTGITAGLTDLVLPIDTTGRYHVPDGYFLISVIDGYSRYIVHHELRTSMEEYDVEITIERALEKFPFERPGLISDNGSQYVSRDFAEFLRLTGLQHTRTSVGYPQSNGKIERFHESISQECLRKRSLIDIEDARKQVAEYIEYYNTRRLHSALYYLTPEDYLNG
ncbi:MAG: transposase, partial [Candidatus Kryptoniota bacterium]